MMSAIVTAQNLTHTFGKGALCKPVLSNIDLELKSGEIVILEGPSGSGKTTLLTLIGALRTVQSGSLTVLNQALHRSRRAALIRTRNQIGFIFQHHNLLACLTAWENVSTSLRLHPQIPKTDYRDRAEAILAAVGLADKVDAYPENLSGGQKQRVAIARALVNHPQLLLADEPTSSLDSHSGRNVVEIIQQLAREEGCTVLLVTHDSRILDIADRVLHMEDGRLGEG
ncbi:MAG: ATP-binding cassette domain-containing protein [Leptolyngbyaceae cyanobacterium]